MLHGRHGIGKSEIVKQAAKQLGIEIIKLDLSLLETPDLVGMPYIKDGRTGFAPPDFLPGPSTHGILMIEEINRAPRYMQAPCLELLTERRLHSYPLPPGWVPCGAINPAADGYWADELDPALLSRFLNVTVVADVTEWVAWAGEAGVHAKVIGFVQASPDVFNDPAANPRAWEYCSKFLIEWEKENQNASRDEQVLLTALAGFVGSKWAVAFHRVYTGKVRALEAAEIVKDYPVHRSVVRGWVRQCRLDMVESSMKQLQQHLQAQRVYEAVSADPHQKANVEGFWADLPAELQRQVREWLKERGFAKLCVPTRSRKLNSFKLPHE